MEKTVPYLKNLAFAISLSCLLLSFSFVPSEQMSGHKIAATAPNPSLNDSGVSWLTSSESLSDLYTTINLEQYGLSKEAFDYACKGYQRLLEKKRISRADYLTICDFSQSSNNKRLYLLDLVNQKLLTNTYVAHGRNSGAEYATRFSNRSESLQSSLGFYITQGTYTGAHGLALKVNGVDAGFNDKAGQRNIVIHGAAYIDENWLRHSSYMGRSYGCPAIPQRESKTIINTIKNGTCLFIYHPSKDYLLRSKILNG